MLCKLNLKIAETMAKGFEYFSRLIRNAKEVNANNSLSPPPPFLPSSGNGEEGYDSSATLLQLRDRGVGRGRAGAKVEVEVEVVEEVPLTTVAHKLFNRWIGSGL